MSSSSSFSSSSSSSSSHLLLFLLPLLLAFSTTLASTQLLAEDEIEALRDIAKTLGKTNWNFSVDPCSDNFAWLDPKARGIEFNITCNCTSTSCHVTNIVLKFQNLPGKLPPDLIRLPFLQQIDLSFNYLSGSIPPEWGALRLSNINLVGNRLDGSLPVELANITTLESLAIDFNGFSGVLPAELGNLPKLERMLLTSNNFTGKLPGSFARLTTLKEFKISDNSFSGKIPGFIQNWTNLSKLVIQASGLTGPIPSGISLLTELTDLIITDLNGPDLSFPRLKNLKKLEKLMLRNCNISGTLPEYLVEMKNLDTLDLSFNKLTGQVPRSFSGLANLEHTILTGNMLNGSVPDWLKSGKVDLSYNDFTINSKDDACQPENLNLFASSSGGNASSVSCLEKYTAKCPEKLYYYIEINCGGPGKEDGDEKFHGHKEAEYEDDDDGDLNKHDPSPVYKSKTNWVSSNTGFFPYEEDDDTSDSFMASNISQLSITNPDLYMNARISPISLTYYGFCLENRNYTVNLYFAEIIFQNGRTYRSLGRRFFDIYIQGSLVMKDFNIASKAGGFGKPFVQPFNVSVTSNTLEIRLFWAGKGITVIPELGTYGPLISAISVHPTDPSYNPEDDSIAGGGISIGVAGGVVTGGIFIILLIFVLLWWNGFLRRERTLEQDLSGVDLQTSKFSLRQIKAATNNFDPSNKIGEGGFGPVHKGVLSDGTIIAVKQLSAKSKQGNREFVNEIGMISALRNPHLVKLYGCGIDGNHLLLIYEYMENNSLARALFGRDENQLKLDWRTRHTICVGIARGLTFLHEESRLKIVHRDIKATNVLLDKNLFPKISDFGLAKLDEEENTHISTRIAGTYGYMAPEYAMHGYLTDKADVYSFGIVVLEIVSGMANTTFRTKQECFILLDWALALKQKGKLLELVDPRMGSHFNKEEMMITINVALVCTNVIAAERPMMSSVVSMLEGNAPVEELVLAPNEPMVELTEMWKNLHSNVAKNTSENSERQTLSTSGPWTAASTSSISDLYPINPDSSYWENRNH